MKRIFELVDQTERLIPENDSYLLSYPILRDYFSNIHSYDSEKLVVAAHAVYGWMPTVLTLQIEGVENDLNAAAQILNKAKNNEQLSNINLEILKRLINNSIVGTSKLLHFVNPEKYAIWDSKIYEFIKNEAPYNYRVNKVEEYERYIKNLGDLTMDKRFPELQQKVNNMMGYEVSAVRAAELVMFYNAPSRVS